MANKAIFCIEILGYLLLKTVVLTKGNNLVPKLNVTEKYMDVSPGSSLYLECSGHRPVVWYFQDPTTEENRTLQQNYRDLKSHFENTVQLDFESFSDTGKYFCCFEETCPENSSSLYVFVNDEEQLLLPIEDSMFHLLEIFQAEPTFIRCLPTVSGAEVSLWKNSPGKDELVNKTEEVQYDPTTGFFIANPTSYFQQDFSCRATWKDREQTLRLILMYFRQTHIIPQVYIDKSNAEYVLVNSSFTLTCIVAVEKGTISVITWNYPKDIDVDRMEITKTPKSKDIDESMLTEYIKTLTIRKAQKNDEGNYQCNVTDHSKKRNFAEAFVTIYETPLLPVVKLKSEMGIEKTLIKDKGEFVELSASYEVFPFSKQVRLHWTKNGNILWDKPGKYAIHQTNDVTKFTILNLQSADTGTYILTAEATGGSANISFELRVKDIPTVNVTSTESFYYTAGKKYIIICQTIGFPLPQVSWSWKPYVIGSENADDYFELQELSSDHRPNAANFTKTTVESDVTVTLKLFVVAQKSGYYRCRSKNEKGTKDEDIPFFVTDIAEGFAIIAENLDPVEFSSFSMTCGANAVVYKDVVWSWQPAFASNSTTNLTNGLELSQSTYSINLKLAIDVITQNNSGRYKCIAFNRDPRRGPNIKFVTVEVKAVSAPYFKDTNINSTTLEANSNELLELTCFVEGVPQPAVTWYKNGDPLVSNVSGRVFADDYQKLIISRLVDEDNGDYECRAENSHGEVFLKTTLIVLTEGATGSSMLKKGDSKQIAIFAVVGIGVLSTVVLGFLLLRRIYKSKQQKVQMQLFSHKIFLDGQISLFNPDLPLDDQAELLPYDQRWEFSRDRLKLGRTLGQGAFGRVVKAEASGLNDDETSTIVAVKMLKERADKNQQRALMAELKILIHLGHHVNIVNLVGAVTKNIPKGELLVIVEYCRYGNLRHYFLKHRDSFVNQIDHFTGKIDFSRVRLPTSPTGNKDPNYENCASRALSASPGSSSGIALSPSLAVENPNYKERIPLYEKVKFFPTKDLKKSFGNSSSSDTRYTSDGTSGSAETYCRMDSREHTITTSDLVCYAFQCARGMEYLAFRKLIHRDLAARNVLLAEDNIVKICDFGLAKDCYKYSNYVKKGDGPLPVKWMAIESIGDKVFTTKSDVWSFGILLWEFFTLGGNPYPGVDIDEEFYRKLKCGYRMEKPEFAPNIVYQIMKDCWQPDPEKRPDFLQLSDVLGGMLEDGVTQYYIDLNEPYMQMNEKMLDHDYLNVINVDDSQTTDYVNSSVLSSDVNEYDVVPPVRSISHAEVPKEAMEIVPMIHFEPTPKNCKKTTTDSLYTPDYQCMTHKLDDYNNTSSFQDEDSVFYDQ